MYFGLDRYFYYGLIARDGAVVMSTQQQSESNSGCSLSSACLLLVACVFLLATIPSAAQAGLEEDAKRYANAYRSTEKLKAQLALDIQLEAGVATLQDIPGFSDLDNASRRAFSNVLGTNIDQLEQALTKYQQDQKEKLQSLEDDLATRTKERIKQQETLFITQSSSRHLDTRLAALLSNQNRWIWLAAFAAFFGILLVAVHWNRHLIRRQLHGYKTLGLSKNFIYLTLFLLVLFAVTFCFGPMFIGFVGTLKNSTPNEELEEQITELETERDADKLKVDNQQNNFKGMLDKWAGNQPPTKSWKNILQLAADCAVDLKTQQQMAAEILRQAEQQQKAQTNFQEFDKKIQENRSFEQQVYAFAGFSLLGLTTAGGFWILRNIKRKQTEIRGTCPVCLTVGTLEDAEETDESAYGMLRCNKVLTDEPFEECNFTFQGIYRDMQKLCFPTIGHPRAGKTHWLTMTYRQLIRGEYDANVNFGKVKSTSSEDFDRLVSEIVDSKLDPSRTQIDRLPRPLVFNFTDNDWAGKANVLLNVFDYAGEVFTRMDLASFHRRRALDADGYFLFLDPTEPSDVQATALANFQEDVRVVKNQPKGQSLQCPVAICVPKIDLLTTMRYADAGPSGPIASFYDELKEIDRHGRGVCLKSIHARSKAMKRLRDTIWPGWQMEQKLKELFGGRYMFFPLSPVGMSELGETDLTKRTIEPYAVLEPLMWLLQMNGYPVLSRSTLLVDDTMQSTG